MKLKEFGSGGASLAPPLDTPLISKYRKYLSKYDGLYLSFRFWLLLFISGGSARFAYLEKLE